MAGADREEGDTNSRRLNPRDPPYDPRVPTPTHPNARHPQSLERIRAGVPRLIDEALRAAADRSDDAAAMLGLAAAIIRSEANGGAPATGREAFLAGMEECWRVVADASDDDPEATR